MRDSQHWSQPIKHEKRRSAIISDLRGGLRRPVLCEPLKRVETALPRCVPRLKLILTGF